jgi:hypothetical protein
MLRNTAQRLASFALLTLVMLSTQTAQQTASAQTPSTKHTTAKEKRATPKLTNAQKMALAMSAGPAEIAKHATIMGLQALLKVNLRLATTDYLSNGYDGL